MLRTIVCLLAGAAALAAGYLLVSPNDEANACSLPRYFEWETISLESVQHDGIPVTGPTGYENLQVKFKDRDARLVIISSLVTTYDGEEGLGFIPSPVTTTVTEQEEQYEAY